MAGPHDRLRPSRDRPGSRLLPRHAVLVDGVVSLRRRAQRHLHRPRLGHAGIRPLVEAARRPGPLRSPGSRLRRTDRALGTGPAPRRRARLRRGGVDPRRADRTGRVYASLLLVDVVAIPPTGSPFFRFVQDHPDTLEHLPPYIHEAIVRTYISNASHRGLTATDLDQLAAPWLTDDGRSAFYRQIAQYDEQYLVENERRSGSWTSRSGLSGVPRTPGSRPDRPTPRRPDPRRRPRRGSRRGPPHPVRRTRRARQPDPRLAHPLFVLSWLSSAVEGLTRRPQWRNRTYRFSGWASVLLYTTESIIVPVPSWRTRLPPSLPNCTPVPSNSIGVAAPAGW